MILSLLLATATSAGAVPRAAQPLSVVPDLVPAQGGFTHTALRGWSKGPVRIAWSGDAGLFLEGKDGFVPLSDGIRQTSGVSVATISDPARLRSVATRGLWLRVPVSDSLRSRGEYAIGASPASTALNDGNWLQRGLSRRLPLDVRLTSQEEEQKLEVSAPAASGERWWWEGVDTSLQLRSKSEDGRERIVIPAEILDGSPEGASLRLVLRRDGRRILSIPKGTVVRTSLASSDCPDASPAGGFRGMGHGFGPEIICQREQDSITAHEDSIRQARFPLDTPIFGQASRVDPSRRRDSLSSLFSLQLQPEDTSLDGRILHGHSLRLSLYRRTQWVNPPLGSDSLWKGRVVVEARSRRTGGVSIRVLDTMVGAPSPSGSDTRLWSGNLDAICLDRWAKDDTGWEVRARIEAHDTAGGWEALRFSCGRPHPALTIDEAGLRWILLDGTVDSTRGEALGDWEIQGLPLKLGAPGINAEIQLKLHGGRSLSKPGTAIWSTPSGGWIDARWCESSSPFFDQGSRFCAEVDTLEVHLSSIGILLPLSRSRMDSGRLFCDSAKILSLSERRKGNLLSELAPEWLASPVAAEGTVQIGPSGPQLPIASDGPMVVGLLGEASNETQITALGRLEILPGEDGVPRIRVNGPTESQGPRLRAYLQNSPIDDMSTLDLHGSSKVSVELLARVKPNEIAGLFAGIPPATLARPVSMDVDPVEAQPLREGWSLRVRRLSFDSARIHLDSFDLALSPSLVDTSHPTGRIAGLTGFDWKDAANNFRHPARSTAPFRIELHRGWILSGRSARLVAKASSPVPVGRIHDMDMVTSAGGDTYLELAGAARLVAPRATLLDDSDLRAGSGEMDFEVTKLQWGPSVNSFPGQAEGKLVVEAVRRAHRETKGKLALSGTARLREDGIFSLDSSNFSLVGAWLEGQPDPRFQEVFADWGDRLRLTGISGFLPLATEARIPLGNGTRLSGTRIELELGPGLRFRIANAVLHRKSPPTGCPDKIRLREAVVGVDGTPLLLEPVSRTEAGACLL